MPEIIRFFVSLMAKRIYLRAGILHHAAFAVSAGFALFSKGLMTWRRTRMQVESTTSYPAVFLLRFTARRMLKSWLRIGA